MGYLERKGNAANPPATTRFTPKSAYPHVGSAMVGGAAITLATAAAGTPVAETTGTTISISRREQRIAGTMDRMVHLWVSRAVHAPACCVNISTIARHCAEVTKNSQRSRVLSCDDARSVPNRTPFAIRLLVQTESVLRRKKSGGLQPPLHHSF